MSNCGCRLTAIFCVAGQGQAVGSKLSPNLMRDARVQLHEQKTVAVVVQQGECIEARGLSFLVDGAYMAPRIAKKRVAKKRFLTHFSLHNGDIEFSDLPVSNRRRKLFCPYQCLREHDDPRGVSVEPVEGAWHKRDRRG